MTALSAAALRTGPRTRSSARLVRVLAFGALALYAAAHWATLVRPSADGTMLALLVIAVAAGVTADLARGVGRLPVRTAALAAITLVAIGAVLLAAGAPLHLLRPDRWPQLVSQIGGALGDLPAVRVPYTGRDAWIQTVTLAGGGLLLLIAAACTLRADAQPFTAAVALGVLYGVPVVEHSPDHPWLDGAVFALLLGVSLWGDRLRRREVAPAVAVGLVAVLAAGLAAPRLDSGSPWLDYESLAESLQGGSGTTFRWNHGYGPMDWPRTGVELARVRSRGDLYMKTANLERFNGTGWMQARTPDGQGDTEIDYGHRQWRQNIRVEITGLRSRQFLGAGTTTYIRKSSRPVHEATPGTFEVDDKPLRRGDSYEASVYVPAPNPPELSAAGTDYPDFVSRELQLQLPSSAAAGSYGPITITFPTWSHDGAMTASVAGGLVNVDPRAVLQSSPYARAFALAERIKRTSTDPYDYVRAVIDRVRRGARYTENPPPPGRMKPLEAFLFRDRAGYCQHFAGATALLLRMGGVPARVAAGFSPGSRNGSGEHVIRDFDAHSWVEVYFPGIGWVTFDPTPGDSPAASQLTDRNQDGAGSTVTSAPEQQTTSTVPRQARGRDQDVTPAKGDGGGDTAIGKGGQGGGGVSPALVVLLGAVALVGGGAAAWTVRRSRSLAASDDPQLEELRRALARTGRPASPDMTLQRLEQALAGSAEARAYLQALRLARFGAPGADGRPPSGPTPAQRRALRRELGAGLGLRGRMRALVALPPSASEVAKALNGRRRPPYTA